ncbi:hypothetical protein V6N13_047667 [Hibiscus sabdariffa]|uniref:Uncharacterized protein n=1 Tax=Hibiscus sabdariffa TaxID=183260 RepID=A0ABR2F4V3_9ROSI
MDLKANKLDVRIDGRVQEKGLQMDLLTKEGEEPDMLSPERRVTCYTALVVESNEKLAEPKRWWAKVVEDLVNSSQIQSWKDQEIKSSD